MLRLTLPQQQDLEKYVPDSIRNQIQLLPTDEQAIDNNDLIFLIHLLNVSEYFKVYDGAFADYLLSKNINSQVPGIFFSQYNETKKRLRDAGIIMCTGEEIIFIATKPRATDTLLSRPNAPLYEAGLPLSPPEIREHGDDQATLQFLQQLDDEYQAFLQPVSPVAQTSAPARPPILWDFDENLLLSPPPLDPVIQELAAQPLPYEDQAAPQVPLLQDLSQTESQTHNPAPAVTATSLIQDELRNLSQQLKAIAAASQPDVSTRAAYASLSKLLSDLNPDLHSMVEKDHAEKVHEKIKQSEAKKRLRGDDSSSHNNDEEIELHLQQKAVRQAKNRRAAVNYRVNAQDTKIITGLLLETLNARVEAMAHALEPAAPPVTVIPSADRSAPGTAAVAASSPLQRLSLTNSFNSNPVPPREEAKVSKSRTKKRR